MARFRELLTAAFVGALLIVQAPGVSAAEPLPIIPGMITSVDILTGKKTILAYLLKPILRAKYLALRER